MYICVDPFEKQTKLRREDISRESSWLNCIKYFLHVSLTFFCNEERQKQSEPTIWWQPAAPVQFTTGSNIELIMPVKKQSWSKSKLSNHANYEDRARGDLILGLLLGSKRRPASSNITLFFAKALPILFWNSVVQIEMYLSTPILPNSVYQLGDPVVNAKAWIWILTMRRWCSSAWREGTGHQSGPRQVSNMGTSQICDRKF